MKKRVSQVKCGPAQPLLPSLNLAKLLTVEPTWCGCECEHCPPWLHLSSECSSKCARMSVPPLSNTGVHDRRSAAASGDSCIVPDAEVEAE